MCEAKLPNVGAFALPPPKTPTPLPKDGVPPKVAPLPNVGGPPNIFAVCWGDPKTGFPPNDEAAAPKIGADEGGDPKTEG